MMRFLNFVLVPVLVMLAAGQAVADAYPVSSTAHPEASGFFIDPSMSWAVTAPSAYYKVYGEWPQSWAALRESGIFQVDLLNLNGQVIDPDDGVWDFSGDMAYIFNGPDTPPLIKVIGEGEGMNIMTRDVVVPASSFAELFSHSSFSNAGGHWAGLAEDENRLKMFAIESMLKGALKSFLITRGALPNSWAEFMESGLTPIDQNSINPLTGMEFGGDGRPNDFIFSTNGMSFELLVTDQNGDTPWQFSL